MSLLRVVSRQLGKPWYPVLVAGLAFADIFLLVFPTDAFLVSAVAVNRRRWAPIAALVALGSAAGALLFTWLALTQLPWLESQFPILSAAKDQLPAMLLFFREYAGLTVLCGAVGPLPMHPFLLGAAVYGMPAVEVALWVLLGRALKYSLFAWCTAYLPRALSSFHRLREELRNLRQRRILRRRAG